jgi:hypothetical protein
MDVYTASLPDMQEGAAKRLEEILGGADKLLVKRPR